MVTKIVMPQLGTTMTEGILEKWLKKAGDPVIPGEKIAEISTDKYQSEIESEVEGYLRCLLADEGELVPVLAPVALVASTREELLPESFEARDKGVGERQQTSPLEREPATGKRIFASPLAKKTAQRLGVRLEDIPVNPARTRIKQADVLTFAGDRGDGRTARAVAPNQADEAIPLTPMRRTIAARMLQSAAEIPQVTLMREADATQLMRLRSQYNQLGRDHVTINDILVKICAQALRRFPALNASYTGQGIVPHRQINVGVAVALKEGLVVPVIRGADRLGIGQIAGEARNLARLARQGDLPPADAQGATFTISNIGKYGVAQFTPLVNPGECAILGVGAVCARPVWDENGQIAAAQMLGLSLSFDHRAVDGEMAARFLKEIADCVANPAILLFES